MRRENHIHRLPRRASQNLLNLRLMAMLANAVGGNALVALGIERIELRRSPRAGNPTLAVDDDVVRLDETDLQQWRQRQDCGSWIAAGIGHQLRRRNLRPE